ncbi:DNA polymerase alpha subunit B N-terminal-domain-containing protein [Tirmania nivea]|nr:DNA polymerase alpha subunit B N-terminal-domain-containing protein [Tirmania nivea]
MSTEDDPATTTTATSALAELFGPAPLPPAATDELQSMLRLYKLTPEELFFKWESYSLKLNYDADINISVDLVRDFKRDVQQMLEAEVRGKRAAGGAGPRAVKAEAGAGDALGLFDTPRKNTGTKRKYDRTPFEAPSSKKYAANDGIASSPLPVRTPMKSLSISQPPPITPFSKRPSPYTIRETFNSHLSKPDPPTDPTTFSTRIRLTANVDVKKFSYRPMYQKQYESSRTLDDKIEAFLSLISDTHNIPFDEFTDPSSASPGDVVAIGRICSDSVSDGKLNQASLVLESCRRVGAGSRIPLKFDKLEKLPESFTGKEGNSFSLFPGQIVALRGVNPNGKFFSVKEILGIPPLPIAASQQQDLLATNQKCVGGLRVMIAVGPYTTHDNLDYEPLTELCERARDSKPDVLILLGPFIDIDHPMIAEGDFDLDTTGDDAPDDPEIGATLEDLFRQRISSKIRIVDANATMVILIPSTRDAVSKHISFPQEALSKRNLELGKHVKCLPNPVVFSLNEVVVAATTVDTLFDLCRAQILIHPTSLPPAPQSTISIPPTNRALRHILTQRAFYPLFPPPPAPGAASAGAGGGGPPLDLPHLWLADLNILPDVLIFPSQLDAFARAVDSVVAVNPGRVCRKAGYGTFVEMWIGGRDEDKGEEVSKEGKVEHKVWERARVDVIGV